MIIIENVHMYVLGPNCRYVLRQITKVCMFSKYVHYQLILPYRIEPDIYFSEQMMQPPHLSLFCEKKE